MAATRLEFQCLLLAFGPGHRRSLWDKRMLSVALNFAKIEKLHLLNLCNAKHSSKTIGRLTRIGTCKDVYRMFSTDILRHHAQYEDSEEIRSIFTNERTISKQDWEVFLQQLKDINPKLNEMTISGFIMAKCRSYQNFPLGDSYIEYLEDKGSDLNIATIKNFLQLSGLFPSLSNEEKVLRLIDMLKLKCSTISGTLCSSMILGLCATTQWKSALEYLNLLHIASESVSLREVYSTLMSTAFRNGDTNVGWQMLDEMQSAELKPLDKAYTDYLEYFNKFTSSVKEEKLIKFFENLKLYNVIVSQNVVTEVGHYCESLRKGITFPVTVLMNGICLNCGSLLEQQVVDQESFDIMRKEFIDKVVIGSDVFHNTTSREWNRFCQFLEVSGTFTHVVDGLNVIYHASAKLSKQTKLLNLLHCVRYLTSKPGVRVLVIIKRHVLSWSKECLKELNELSTVFTVMDLSRDDCFSLYATLQSGIDTKIITGDYLRNHAFKMPRGPIRQTFKNWLKLNQMFPYRINGEMHLADPPTFGVFLQKNEMTGHWHIPYYDSVEKKVTWACIKL